jgi:hypothetical protein
MIKKFAKRDLFINLLPREYLPEPEFKAFWIIAIVLVGLLGWYLYQDYDAIAKELAGLEADKVALDKSNQQTIPQIVPVPVIQASSRYILSYLYTLPGIMELGPDWLNIYLELENNVPTGLWVESMRFVGGNDSGVWPGISIKGISTAPQAVDKVLDLAEKLEKSPQFIGVTLRGWQWVDLPEGNFGVSFQVDMGIER